MDKCYVLIRTHQHDRARFKGLIKNIVLLFHYRRSLELQPYKPLFHTIWHVVAQVVGCGQQNDLWQVCGDIMAK